MKPAIPPAPQAVGSGPTAIPCARGAARITTTRPEGAISSSPRPTPAPAPLGHTIRTGATVPLATTHAIHAPAPAQAHVNHVHPPTSATSAVVLAPATTGTTTLEATPASHATTAVPGAREDLLPSAHLATRVGPGIILEEDAPATPPTMTQAPMSANPATIPAIPVPVPAALLAHLARLQGKGATAQGGAIALLATTRHTLLVVQLVTIHAIPAQEATKTTAALAAHLLAIKGTKAQADATASLATTRGPFLSAEPAITRVKLALHPPQSATAAYPPTKGPTPHTPAPAIPVSTMEESPSAKLAAIPAALALHPQPSAPLAPAPPTGLSPQTPAPAIGATTTLEAQLAADAIIAAIHV